MRFPDPCDAMTKDLATVFPDWTPAQQRGLALWVYGALLAGSVCQTAVLTALAAYGRWHTVRAALREWLRSGADKAAPCHTAITVGSCFAPLLAWVVRWWQGDTLPVAIDATTRGQDLVVLAVSVLYRGTAIPVAWQILPAPGRGNWITEIRTLLDQMQPGLAARPTLQVLVMTDRGLWSPVLWDDLIARGWQPLMRLALTTTVRPTGQHRQPARRLVAGPGHAWVGAAVVFKERPRRRTGTVLVVWATGQHEPWIVLTSLSPTTVGTGWYGGRMWIELGFRALKSMGWQWQRTVATAPDRVGRQWLILAVATLWAVAVGTAWEAEAEADRPPWTITPPAPPTAAAPTRPRLRPPAPVSVLRRGVARMRVAWIERTAWPDGVLQPTPLPEPHPPLSLTVHQLPIHTIPP